MTYCVTTHADVGASNGISNQISQTELQKFFNANLSLERALECLLNFRQGDVGNLLGSHFLPFSKSITLQNSLRQHKSAVSNSVRGLRKRNNARFPLVGTQTRLSLTKKRFSCRSNVCSKAKINEEKFYHNEQPHTKCVSEFERELISAGSAGVGEPRCQSAFAGKRQLHSGVVSFHHENCPFWERG